MASTRVWLLSVAALSLLLYGPAARSCSEIQEAGTPIRRSETALKPFCMEQEEVTSHEGGGGVAMKKTAEIKTCRDSKGRTRVDRSFIFLSNGLPERKASENTEWAIQVTDPAGGTSMMWGTHPSGPKSVRVSHFKPHEPQAAVGNRAPLPMSSGDNELDGSRRPLHSIDTLGIRSIEGTIAHGFRDTRYFPAGSVGNNVGFSVKDESWISTDFRVLLEQDRQSPTEGDRTLTLKSFVPGEPDETLFELPAGYAVDE